MKKFIPPITLNMAYSYEIPMWRQSLLDSDDWYCRGTSHDEDAKGPDGYGLRNIMPVGVFENYYIVKTWLQDPNGCFCSTYRMKLITKNYMKQIVRKCNSEKTITVSQLWSEK